MKLFLSSQAISEVQAPHVVKLVGKLAKNIRMALIENAADVEPGPKAWLRRNREVIMSHGFDVDLIDLKQYEGRLAELKRKLASKDMVWLGGGNVFYLRWLLRKTGADQIICDLVRRGMTYGGGSAGAIVAGPTLKHFEAADNPDDAPQIMLEGLGLADVVVVPHVDNEKYATIVTSINKKLVADGYKTAPLKDTEALIINDNKQRII